MFDSDTIWRKKSNVPHRSTKKLWIQQLAPRPEYPLPRLELTCF